MWTVQNEDRSEQACNLNSFMLKIHPEKNTHEGYDIIENNLRIKYEFAQNLKKSSDFSFK